jgi:hypothetical protein
MQYVTTVPFDGNTAKAFDLALSALTPLGFQAVTRDALSLELVGPGMNSTRQSALLGASRIQITRSGRELAIEAELGGVEWMGRFLVLFPIGLCLFLAVLFFVVFSLLFNNRLWVIPVVAVTGGNALLWLFLAPYLTRVIKARTCRGIDALLNNMALTGETAGASFR